MPFPEKHVNCRFDSIISLPSLGYFSTFEKNLRIVRNKDWAVYTENARKVDKNFVELLREILVKVLQKLIFFHAKQIKTKIRKDWIGFERFWGWLLEQTIRPYLVNFSKFCLDWQRLKV